ncbi:MAG: PDC sensor domain-containing protein, partial [Burkholderiaceae bacterium]
MVISFGRHRIGGQQAARPLRQRVLLAVVGSTIVLLGVLGITITQINLARLEREEGNTLLANARYFAELLDMTIGRQLMDLESRATLLPILALHQEPAKLATWLTTIQAKIPEYTWIGFANAKGQIVASGNQILRDHDVTRREWFQAGQQQARTLDLHDAQLLSAHMPVRIDGQPWRFIDLVAPVRHRNGTLLGVLGAHLSWDWLIAQHQRFS